MLGRVILMGLNKLVSVFTTMVVPRNGVNYSYVAQIGERRALFLYAVLAISYVFLSPL